MYPLLIKEAITLTFLYDLPMPTIGNPVLLPSGAKMYALNDYSTGCIHYGIAGYAHDRRDTRKCLLDLQGFNNVA